MDFADTTTGINLLEWLINYGYFIMLPLMLIEGRVVVLTAAVLASFGHFNIYIVWLVAIGASLISDSAYYFLGKSGNKFLEKFWLTRRALKKIKNTEDLSSIADFLNKHGIKIFFMTKSLPSITVPLEVIAGAVGMNLKKYYIGIVLGNVFWLSLFTAFGFHLSRQLRDLYLIIFVLLALMIVAYYLKVTILRRISWENLFTTGRHKIKSLFNGNGKN